MRRGSSLSRPLRFCPSTPALPTSATTSTTATATHLPHIAVTCAHLWIGLIRFLSFSVNLVHLWLTLIGLVYRCLAYCIQFLCLYFSEITKLNMDNPDWACLQILNLSFENFCLKIITTEKILSKKRSLLLDSTMQWMIIHKLCQNKVWTK